MKQADLQMRGGKGNVAPKSKTMEGNGGKAKDYGSNVGRKPPKKA